MGAKQSVMTTTALPPVLTKQQVRVIVLEAYANTDSGAAFEAALAEQNLLLCRGDRRAYACCGCPR